MNRMLADVPSAEVVLVNPTHYAVALAWDRAGGGAPLMLIPVKYAAKKALVSIGTKPARANWTVETAGMFAACNNIALLAGGVPPAAIGIGAVCAIAFSQNSRNRYERRTGRTLDGAPLAQTRVQ